MDIKNIQAEIVRKAAAVARAQENFKIEEDVLQAHEKIGAIPSLIIHHRTILKLRSLELDQRSRDLADLQHKLAVLQHQERGI